MPLTPLFLGGQLVCAQAVLFSYKTVSKKGANHLFYAWLEDGLGCVKRVGRLACLCTVHTFGEFFHLISQLEKNLHSSQELGHRICICVKRLKTLISFKNLKIKVIIFKSYSG